MAEKYYYLILRRIYTMTMEERKAKGLLWTDTPEAMEAQARARGLVYDFNHTRPEEKEKRMEHCHRMQHW